MSLKDARLPSLRDKIEAKGEVKEVKKVEIKKTKKSKK